MNSKWVCIVCGILLLLGIPTGWPYSYYVLLRWIVCFASIFVAYSFYKANLSGWTWVFGAIALLFNPILPFYLNKGLWVLIDLVSSVLFFVSAYSIKQK
jgi:uncharacterized membrane protein YesL